MWSAYEYEKLSTAAFDHEDILSETSTPPNQRSKRRFVIALIALSIGTAGFLLAGLVLVTNAQSTSSDNGLALDCGETPDEAISKGCVFEQLGSWWVPQLCSFPELNNRYDDIFDKWDWFADPALTVPLPEQWQLDVLRSGNYTSAFTSALNGMFLNVRSWEVD
jgi:hypothetical protein